MWLEPTPEAIALAQRITEEATVKVETPAERKARKDAARSAARWARERERRLKAEAKQAALEARRAKRAAEKAARAEWLARAKERTQSKYGWAEYGLGEKRFYPVPPGVERRVFFYRVDGSFYRWGKHHSAKFQSKHAPGGIWVTRVK